MQQTYTKHSQNQKYFKNTMKQQYKTLYIQKINNETTTQNIINLKKHKYKHYKYIKICKEQSEALQIYEKKLIKNNTKPMKYTNNKQVKQRYKTLWINKKY